MGLEVLSLLTESPWVAPLGYFLVHSLVLIGAFVVYRQLLLPQPIPGIAYNASAAASLLGDAPDMARAVKDTGEFGPWCAAQIVKAGAPLCQVFVRPFAKPWVLLADFREAQDILGRRTVPTHKDEDADFDKSTFITDSMHVLGDFHGTLRASTRGSDFKRGRALIQDLMAPTFLQNVVGPTVHGKAMELVQLLETKMRLADGRPFRIEADLDSVALDVMLHLSFGGKFDQTSLGPQLDTVSGMTTSDIPDGYIDEPVTFPVTHAGAFIATVRSVPDVIESYIASVAPRLKLWWWKKQSWYKAISSLKNDYFRAQIRKALGHYRDGEVRSAVAHMMIRVEREAERQGCAPELSRHATDVVADELFGQILAGSHTTGGALGWLVKYLTIYPHFQGRLRDDLYAALPQAAADRRPPSTEELRRARLPFLDAFIEETLRLNSVPITRETIRDTTILGRRIPKGCLVFLVSNGPGFLSPPLGVVDASERSPAARAARLNDRWDSCRDLGAFDPERWLVGGSGNVNAAFDAAAGPQLVFGHGVRGCWGKRLAQMEMRIVVALLVWHLDMLPVPKALASNDATDAIARRPRNVFVRLRKVVRTNGRYL